MTDPPDPATLGELLADDCARGILEATKGEPCSAAELSERTGVSEPTVYRRLERLQAQDLVEAEIRPVPDGKNYKVYRASLEGVELDLADDGFDVTVTRREPMADRFTRIVEEM